MLTRPTTLPPRGLPWRPHPSISCSDCLSSLCRRIFACSRHHLLKKIQQRVRVSKRKREQSKHALERNIHRTRDDRVAIVVECARKDLVRMSVEHLHTLARVHVPQTRSAIRRRGQHAIACVCVCVYTRGCVHVCLCECVHDLVQCTEIDRRRKNEADK